MLLDEREDSINDGFWVLSMSGYPDPTKTQVIDYPAAYHNGAGGLSFADGHSEIRKWVDPRTKPKFGAISTISAPNNRDIFLAPGTLRPAQVKSRSRRLASFPGGIPASAAFFFPPPFCKTRSRPYRGGSRETQRPTPWAFPGRAPREPRPGDPPPALAELLPREELDRLSTLQILDLITSPFPPATPRCSTSSTCATASPAFEETQDQARQAT